MQHRNGTYSTFASGKEGSSFSSYPDMLVRSGLLSDFSVSGKFVDMSLICLADGYYLHRSLSKQDLEGLLHSMIKNKLYLVTKMGWLCNPSIHNLRLPDKFKGSVLTYHQIS